jgi:hypothetical protein
MRRALRCARKVRPPTLWSFCRAHSRRIRAPRPRPAHARFVAERRSAWEWCRPLARHTMGRCEMVRRLTCAGCTYSSEFYRCCAARDRVVVAKGGGEVADEDRECQPKTISIRLVRHTGSGSGTAVRTPGGDWGLAVASSLASLHALHGVHPSLQAHHGSGALQRHWLGPKPKLSSPGMITGGVPAARVGLGLAWHGWC